MKKIISLVLVVGMIFAMSANVFAATITETSSPQTANSTVQYVIAPSAATYIVTVPTTMDAATASPTVYNVTAANVFIGATQTLKVNITNRAANVVNTANGAFTLAYDLAVGGTTAPVGAQTTEVLSVAAGTATGTGANITSTITGTAVTTGTFTDTVTFEVSVA